MTNHNTQLVPGFTIVWCLCPSTRKCGYSLGSAGTFACGEAIWPVLGELFHPLWHTDPSDPAVHSWGFALLPHQITTRHLAVNFQTLCFTVYRILVASKPSPFFPSIVLGTRFLVQSPQVFSLSLSLSLFLSSYVRGKSFPCTTLCASLSPFLFLSVLSP